MKIALLCCCLALVSWTAGLGGAAPVLRVCADPNNLPFSNDKGEGFENHLAQMIASDTGRTVQYTWWAQRRGFVRNTLNARDCDVIMGVPREYEMAATTRPYYRSAYAFVTRPGTPAPTSLDDPTLRNRIIGVQLIGDDFANSPPAHALSARGIVRNVRGYSVYGNYREAHPSASIVRAVAAREVDVAIAWGPLAGYFARQSRPALVVTPVTPERDGPGLPFTFEIAMAVRRDDKVLRQALDGWIEANGGAIDRLLDGYGVPRLPLNGAAGRRK